MKTVKALLLTTIILLIITTFLGCAIQRYIWKIEPQSQTIQNAYFSASIAPAGFSTIWDGYQAFELTIKNKTSIDMELDWNKTAYIENNQTKGGFMFEGIVYKDRNNLKPPDIIFANSVLRKNIFPNTLVNFSKSWYHHPIPSGNNGIYLSIKIKGKELNEKILLNMIRVPAQ